MIKYKPYAVYNGAVFDMPVTLYNKESYAAAVPQLTDLIFDIDMDSYDEYRFCGC